MKFTLVVACLLGLALYTSSAAANKPDELQLDEGAVAELLSGVQAEHELQASSGRSLLYKWYKWSPSHKWSVTVGKYAVQCINNGYKWQRAYGSYWKYPAKYIKVVKVKYYIANYVYYYYATVYVKIGYYYYHHDIVVSWPSNSNYPSKLISVKNYYRYS